MSDCSSPGCDRIVSPVLNARTLQLNARLSLCRWQHVAARASERTEILAQTATRYVETGSWRKALDQVAPEVGWSAYQHWRRCAAGRSGEPWERQLDERVPPTPYRVSSEIRIAACALRHASATMDCVEAQRRLVAQFGPEKGKVSATSLKRIWQAAGLAQPRGRRSFEKVQRFSAGGGLALLAAAAAETEVGRELARAVMVMAKEVGAKENEAAPMENQASPMENQAAVADKAAVPTEHEAGVAKHEAAAEAPAGRDDAGRFTAEYNRAVRGSGDRDPRWLPDAVKRKRRDLSTLTISRSREDTIAHQLLVIGLVPLVTERRGFDGLDGPSGGWLGAMGGTAYKAATLDRALAELALLNAGAALWNAHAQQWTRLTRPWSEDPDQPRWLRWVQYIDATQDPYWTRHFAASGKVSRVGRVMPCVTRVALMGGPGVPLWVETRAGTVSLKKELLPVLARFEKAVGEGELGRLTVIDAEMATVPLLVALSARAEKWFITVLKGAVGHAAQRIEEGAWQKYRERDLLRELKLRVHGKEAPVEGLVLRAVEMAREGSRNPTSTVFATDAAPDELSTDEVASAYLSRWPHQEQRFRDGRNGLGLERSHGYGGAMVSHVALATAQEKALRCLDRAQRKVTVTQAQSASARALLEATARAHRSTARDQVVRAEREARRAEKDLQAAKAEVQRLATTPREIYVRDTTRDGIVTCMKMTVLMLIEYVLKEYFGGLRMEVRSFIENYLWLPVTVRETASAVVYQIEGNPRSPADIERLRAACAEATRRGIMAGGKRLRFELVVPGAAPDG